jgi:hypothetical protein
LKASELDELSRGDYYETLAAMRLGRLISVTLKQPFTRVQEVVGQFEMRRGKNAALIMQYAANTNDAALQKSAIARTTAVTATIR